MRDCRCDEGSIASYNAKLSGPLMDRIDLHVHVRPVPWRRLDSHTEATGESSETVRKRVLFARERQAKRLAAFVPGFPETATLTNAAIPPEVVGEAVASTPEARVLLGRAVDRFGLSARAAHRLLRVARTVADLDGESEVGPRQMAEALAMREEG